MAVIYMIHPKHGAKVAISEEEAISDEMYGWMRYEHEEEEAEISLAAPPSKRRRATQEG